MSWSVGGSSEIGRSSLQPPAVSRHARISLNISRHRTGIRSIADRRHLAIGLTLSLVGLAAVGAIHFLGVKGSFATMIGAFSAFAILFGRALTWNRSPIFPPSEIYRQNRLKYLVLAALLWGAVFLLWWWRVHTLGR